MLMSFLICGLMHGEETVFCTFDILKVYAGTLQNTVDIRKLNAFTHAIMQVKLLHAALRSRLIILNKVMYN